MNGAASIHDFEIALVGHQRGCGSRAPGRPLGAAEETGRRPTKPSSPVIAIFSVSAKRWAASETLPITVGSSLLWRMPSVP
jgi:hypothetical protein